LQGSVGQGGNLINPRRASGVKTLLVGKEKEYSGGRDQRKITGGRTIFPSTRNQEGETAAITGRKREEGYKGVRKM